MAGNLLCRVLKGLVTESDKFDFDSSSKTEACLV